MTSQSTYMVAPDGDAATEEEGPMTNKQATILRALAEKTGEPFDGGLNRRQAERRIAFLQEMAD